MRKIVTYASLLFLTMAAAPAFSQYQINGNASDLGGGCYQLTPNTGAQVGSVWNTTEISLSQPFDFTFNVFLGCDDAGADGICFGLQPLGTTIGSSGNGMGLGGISPSLGVYIDTYQNSTPDNDPTYDHISINSNGDVTHTSANNLAGPVQASAASDNIEDCANHTLEVQWDPVTQTYSVWFDGDLRVSYTGDIITNIFGGNPNVYWGFTGATGGLTNQQSFCLIATANFTANTVCAGNPTTLTDQSYSGNTITSWSWNFGDGSPVFSGSTAATYQNPVHTYAAAGTYNVLETITNSGGATSSISHTVTVVAPPTTTASGGTTVCSNQPVNLTGTVGGSSNVVLSMSSSGSVGIPDNGVSLGWTGTGGSFATSNISVSGLNAGWSLASIVFNITHTFDGDLIAYLFDPCGNSIQLISSTGSSGDNFTNTTFTPSATTSVNSGSAPFNGTFVPSGGTAAWNAFLSASAGCATANGTWSLHVGDKAGADVGTINNWSLNFNNPTTPSFSWAPTAGMTNSTTLNPTVNPGTTTTYTLTATNSLGCISTATTTVTVAPAPTLLITNPAAVCAPGSVDLTAPAVTSGSSAGTFAYYSDSTATTPLSSPNAVTGSGTYYIQSTSGSCSVVEPVTVTISPAPVLSIHNPPAICSPGSIDLTDAAVTAGSIGSGTLSYYMDSATTVPLSSPNAVTSSGTYYILSEVGSCSDVKPVTVTINPAPVLNITNPPAVCGPASVDITDPAVTAGSTGGGSLSYYADSATTIPLSSPNAITASGTYYILSQTAFCSDTKPVVVTINTMPSLTITNPAAVCGPASIDLTDAAITAGSTGGGTLSYYTDAAGTTPLASPNAVTSSGTYYIQSANGSCKDIEPVTVSITTTPVLAITNPAPVCSPASIDLTDAAVTAGSTGGGTLSYYTDAAGTTPLASPNAVTSSGTYYIQSANGVCKDIKPVTVTITTTPVLSVTSPAAVCGPASIDLTAATVTAGSTGGGTLSYWNNASATSPLSAPNAVTASGTYYIESSNGSCTDIEPVTVTINTTPVLAITSPAAICGPGSVDITAPGVTSGSTGGGTLSYWTNASATSPLSTPTSVTTSGTYYIESSNGSCTDIEPVTVTINTTPSLSITNPAAICGSGSVNLTLAAVTAGSTGGGTLSYWTNAAATSPLATPTAVTTSGTYYIESTNGACHDIAPVTVSINPLPVANAGSTVTLACNGSAAVSLDGSGSSGGASITYTWTTSDGHIVSGSNTTAPVVDQPGNYQLTVANSSTGCSSSSTVAVIGSTSPVASFTATPVTGIAPLPVDFINNSSNATVYAWTFGDGNVSVQSDPANTYTQPGSYQVCLIAANTGCADTSCIRIEVSGNFAFELPNVFTPNGDGHNDVFRPVLSEGVSTLEGAIYDRWGLKLYEWNNINGGWDGKAKSGAMSPDGTYYYIIKASGADAKEHEYTGYITLLSK